MEKILIEKNFDQQKDLVNEFVKSSSQDHDLIIITNNEKTHLSKKTLGLYSPLIKKLPQQHNQALQIIMADCEKSDAEGFLKFITTGNTEGSYEQVVTVTQMCLTLGINPNIDYGQEFKLETW